jgi:hypothetical protein
MLTTVRDPFHAALVILLTLGCSVVAFVELTRASDVIQLRQTRLIASSNPQAHRASIEVAARQPPTVLEWCAPGAVEARIEIDVMFADGFTPLSQREAWVEALKKLQEHAQKALQCQPTNGLIWARLAFANWFLGGSAQDQARYLSNSELYAPAELAALNARFAQWVRVTPAVMAQAMDSFERDLRTVLMWMPAGPAVKLLQTLPPRFASDLDAIVKIVPPERMASLVRHGFVPTTPASTGTSSRLPLEMRPSL